MTKKERQILERVAEDVDYIRNKVKVNGVDGTDPIMGMENIFEHLNANQKKMSLSITDLNDVTKADRDKRDRRRLIKRLVDAYHLKEKLKRLKSYWWLVPILGPLLGMIFKWAKPAINILSQIKF